MEPKRFYRSLSDRKIGGVAGGLAEYFVMDPLLIRLAFVVLTFLTGGGAFLLYLILWIVTPDNPVRTTPTMNQPDQNFQQTTYDPAADTAEPPKTETVYSTPQPPTPPTKKRNRGSWVGGLVLITLGALVLIDGLIPQINFWDFWPVILIAVGVGLLINAVIKRNPNTNQY